MSDQGGLQLLPETRRKITVTVPGENRLLYLGVVFLILSATAVFGIKFYTSQELESYNSLRADVEKKNLEINTQAKGEDGADLIEKIRVTGKQLDIASSLLNSHILWSKGLERLEGLLLPTVQVDSLSMSAADGTIKFMALAPSYTAIAKQIASFVSNPKYIKDVTIGEITTQTTGKLQFSMNIEIERSTFLRPDTTPNPTPAK
ncbi:MAG: hypothetical protein UW46_C0002G0012 [Candidatus Yanofskybacteria bacterium GW2011_GWF1_44_227]|uniref:Fimbrial assembly family protein n=1 Tax=Candidatus Yanofskybacteria bacterium GW2011_GWE2_40_11 TaxID=1619033 RepID=A0A0G0QKP7_9BACT|nr:MAG: hypothetical protein UT75_C0006G0052 [Candidatus Yanofskybacteria bacterium GW2011_GWE2_40_11]KKT15766.1 MAG: hypothetical protein UV97_C0002G0012 [Candidatus Yanofskybacteria bacterium GW2011_GWF2_43_596]KKT53456.1 MAG: hypothetical protein UW46_C0002G0012 [Candidatus Yanofskybacteria bacterium GW2011_GWF1_44_227]OGN35865.1 MAG: hypothetical protein A2241_03740 [Candidatus Yanofskybacteria bacterium RIFOXYA2_FULL_45_28]OGN36594.1 MAG: hypothetical protein A2207_00455 [Candidatus Yanofs